MASITPLLDTTYKRSDGLYNLIVRINHGAKRKKISVGYKIKENQFKNGRVVNHPRAGIINARIAAIVSEAEDTIAKAQLQGRPFKIDLIGTGHTSYSFCDYLKHRAKQYHGRGQIVMERKLNRFAKELQMCFGRDVHFNDLTPDALRELDGWLKKEQENINNTRAKKFKFLSEYYDHAIREGKAEAPNPFKGHKITTTPVKKDKLTVAQIEAIEKLALRDGPLNDTRNLFLFSYFCKGMRFAKCITLQRSQIRDGRIFFQTDKGKKYISVKIHPRLQKLLDHYPKGKIVFPFLRSIPEDPTEYLMAVDSQNVIVNRNLKTIASLCGITVNLTFHLARHSFAYHLKGVTPSVSVIQDALGHSDQRITEVYLKALDDEIIDGEVGKVYG